MATIPQGWGMNASCSSCYVLEMRSRVAVVAAVAAIWTVAGDVAADPVTVTIVAPASSAVVGDAIPLSVNVAATFDVSSVVATCPGFSALNLTYAGVPGKWSGTYVLTGAGYGHRTITVTATDGTGTTGVGAVDVLHDLPPSLTVTYPLAGALATPGLYVKAACTDDAPGGCSMRAEIDGTDLATGTGSIDTTVAVPSAFDGMTKTLNIHSRDSSGQETVVSRTIAVSIGGLVPIASVAGPIVDADSHRILYNLSGTVHLLDRTTGVDTVVWSGGEAVMPPYLPVWDRSFRALTSVGAVFGAAAGGAVLEWNGTTLISHATSATEVSIGGYYAAWHGPSVAHRLDVRTGAIVDSSGSLIEHVAVAPSGDLFWARSPGSGAGIAYIERVPAAGGAPVSIASTSDPEGYTNAIATDGSATIWWEGSMVPVLQRDTGTGKVKLSDVNYQAVVDGGVVAFDRLSATGTRQVWTRDASGTEKQITFYTTASKLDAFHAPDDVLYVKGSTRYRVVGGGAEQTISPDAGHAVWRDCGWLVVVGNQLFALAAGTSSGGGSCAPASDAGTDGGSDASSGDAGGADVLVDTGDASGDTTVDDSGDTAVDASGDTAVDASGDAGMDSSAGDSSTGVDSTTDSSSDGTLVDTGSDGGASDSGADTPIDGGFDTRDADGSASVGDTADSPDAGEDTGDGGGGGCMVDRAGSRASASSVLAWATLASIGLLFRRRRS